MKVVLVTEWFPPDIGGVAAHVRDLALSLSARKHEVYVITRKKDRKREWPFELIELEYTDYLKTLYSIPGNTPLKKLLKKIDPDVVHIHHAFTPISLAFTLTSTLNDYPTVLTNHSAYLYDYNALLKALGYVAFPVRRVLKRVDKIIAVSDVAAKFIKSFVPSVPIEVIPNGVDVKKFNPRGSKKLRRSLNSDFIILYVGRLVYRKGVHYLIDSMAFITNEHPKSALVIVGDGPLKRHLKERASELGLDKLVLFLGKVTDDELPDVYRSSDVLVMPSLYGESQGIVALEGMASGLPVIASPVGGLREVITDRVTGLLLESISPRSIANTVLMLHSNPLLSKKISKKAREIVEKKYSWDVIIPKVERVYEEVMLMSH